MVLSLFSFSAIVRRNSHRRDSFRSNILYILDNLLIITFGSSEMQRRPSIIVFCFRVEVLSRFVFSFEETVVTRDTFRYTVFDNNP